MVIIQERGFCQVNNPPPGFGDFQNEIYLAGLTGRFPALPMSYAELERRAPRGVPPPVARPLAGGAGGPAPPPPPAHALGARGLAPQGVGAAEERRAWGGS